MEDQSLSENKETSNSITYKDLSCNTSYDEEDDEEDKEEDKDNYNELQMTSFP